MELVNEWYPTGKFTIFDITFWTYSTHEKECMAALTLTGNDLRKAEMEHHGKFGHNLGWMQHIALMTRIDIFYTTCHMEIQTVSPTLNYFQGLKCCIKYLASHPHKPIFILLLLMMDQMSSDLHGEGIKLKTTQPRIFHNYINILILI